MQIQFEMCERFYPLGGRRVEKKLIDFAIIFRIWGAPGDPGEIARDIAGPEIPSGAVTRGLPRPSNPARRPAPRLIKVDSLLSAVSEPNFGIETHFAST